MPMKRRKKTASQIFAFNLAVNLGRKLKKEIPDIGREYINGTEMKEIIRKMDICAKYNVTDEIAASAIRFAIKGYNGEDGESYSGLLRKDALPDIRARRHRFRGIEFAFNEIGIHSPDYDGRMRSKKASLAKGYIPWVKRREYENYCQVSEVEAAYILSGNPENIIKTRPNYGCIDTSKIAGMLNEIYHDGRHVRTSNVVSKKLMKYRKQAMNSGKMYDITTVEKDGVLYPIG